MKIQLASDLHLEFLQRDYPGERLISPVKGADVLVLPGDIANGAEAFDLFADFGLPTVYVAGNHEFYGQSIEDMRDKMREAAARTGIHFLENESIVLGGVRFLGATLWTDYKLTPNFTRARLMALAERQLNDHRVIRLEGLAFTAQDALSRHLESRAWLEAELAKPFDGKTVVVTHHGPHALSVHPLYAGQPLNSAFVSDLTPLLSQADWWVHGHIHNTRKYCVEGCNVVANPAGYIKNRGAGPGRFSFENEDYCPSMLIDLEL